MNIFVSYRRGDRPGHAGRVGDALRRAFGNDHVFYDVATIRGGVDFAIAIKQAIEKSDVVAAVIGPDWGRRRPLDWLLSRPDWVRFEIEFAREARKPILPVLVDDAGMPRAMPPSLRFLATIHGTSLRDESWDSDVEDLVANLPAVARTEVSSAPAATPAPAGVLTRPIVIASACAAVLLTAWLAVKGWPRTPDPDTAPPSAEPAAVPAVPAAVKAAENRPPTTGRIDVKLAAGAGDGLMATNRVGLVSATRFVLTAQGITDPDGDDIRYRWDFGDGSASPPSAASVEKVYDRVRRFQVKLLVNDGKLPADLLAGETDVTIRDVSGTWELNLTPDPLARYAVPTRYTVTLVQQETELSGRILPTGSSRSTVLTGRVEHPARVSFGSESAWWNDDSDAYFDLQVSDGAIFVQMTNRTPNKCGPQIPCRSLLANRQ